MAAIQGVCSFHAHPECATHSSSLLRRLTWTIRTWTQLRHFRWRLRRLTLKQDIVVEPLIAVQVLAAGQRGWPRVLSGQCHVLLAKQNVCDFAQASQQDVDFMTSSRTDA